MIFLCYLSLLLCGCSYIYILFFLNSFIRFDKMNIRISKLEQAKNKMKWKYFNISFLFFVVVVARSTDLSRVLCIRIPFVESNNNKKKKKRKSIWIANMLTSGVKKITEFWNVVDCTPDIRDLLSRSIFQFVRSHYTDSYRTIYDELLSMNLWNWLSFSQN